MYSIYREGDLQNTTNMFQIIQYSDWKHFILLHVPLATSLENICLFLFTRGCDNYISTYAWRSTNCYCCFQICKVY